MINACIITWVDSLNFGTNLQAFALYSILNQNGVIATVARNAKQHYTFKDKLLGLCQTIGLLRFKAFVRAYIFHQQPVWEYKRSVKIHSWCKSNLRIIETYSNRHIEHLVNNNQLFIAGSDQIWNSWFNFEPAMFLSFAKDKRRISYASSLGTSELNPKYASQISSLLNKFAAIGVREESAVSTLKKSTGRNDIVQVPDPTFLLTQSEWLNFCQPSASICQSKENYALCYMLGTDQNYSRQIVKVCESYGVGKILIVPSMENPYFAIPNSEVKSVVDPFEFINLIRKSALVCTDSFHATCISLIFEKEFVEFLRFNDNDKKSQNSRIRNLLSHFSLPHKIFSESSTDWRSVVDYQNVTPTISADRNRGLDYLLKSI